MSFLSILILIFSPIIIALCILSPFFPNNEIKIRRFCKTFSILHFIYSALFVIFFNSTHLGWSYQKELTFFGTNLIKSLGISASFALDGISLVFVLLVSFVTMLVVIASKCMIRTKHRLYYSLVLFLQAVILGAFSSKDMFLFFLFLQSELIITFLLITQWGEKVFAKQAGIKYLIYNSIGNASLLLGFLILYFYSFTLNGILTADIESLNFSENLYTIGLQSFMFWCLFIGFAIKMLIFPFHSGLITAQVVSSTPISMLLSVLVLCLGGYGFIRFNIGLFPEMFNVFATAIMIMGIINIIYGVTVAISQTNVKKALAYLGMSQIGFVLIGFSVLNEIGFDGALLHLVSFSLIWCGLFMVLGCIYLRTKTMEMNVLGGLNKIMPICYNLGLIIFLCAISSPFTSNFVSNFLILSGLTSSETDSILFDITIFVYCIGLLICSCCLLLIFHKTFYGKVMPQFKTNDNEIIYPKRGITKSEIIVLSLIAFFIIFLGVFPNSLLEIFNSTTEVIIDFLKV